jgi:outer membrane protein TolC
MLLRISTISLFLLAFGVIAYGNVRDLSLDEAVQIALKQNKNVQIARLAVIKADAQSQEAVGNALPTLTLAANYNRNILAPVFFIPNFTDPSAGVAPVRFALNNDYNVTASISQVLFNSAVFTGIGAANIYSEAARAQFRSVVAEVVTETKKRYYGALASKEFTDISQSTLDNAQQNYDNISKLFAEGLVAEFDKIRAQVTVDNIRPTVTDAKSGYANAVSALMQYLDLDFSDTIRPVLSGISDPEAVPSEDSSFKAAMSANYELRTLELQKQVLDRIIDVRRSEYYPTLSLNGRWSNQGQSDTYTNWVAASTAVVGIGFTFNIFSGLRVMAKVEQAQADYETVRQQYELLKDGIRLQVRTIINKMRSALDRIQAQQSTIEQAQRGYDISRIRYTEGTGSLLEINDAEVALARARVNRLSALLDYYSTRSDYDRTVGHVSDRYMSMVEP